MYGGIVTHLLLRQLYPLSLVPLFNDCLCAEEQGVGKNGAQGLTRVTLYIWGVGNKVEEMRD